MSGKPPSSKVPAWSVDVRPWWGDVDAGERDGGAGERLDAVDHLPGDGRPGDSSSVAVAVHAAVKPNAGCSVEMLNQLPSEVRVRIVIR